VTSPLVRRATPAVVALLLLAACAPAGGGSSSTASATASSASSAAAGGPALSVAQTSAGPALTANGGLTLYEFAKDTGSTSACTGTCATNWPPLTVAAGEAASAGPGADTAMLGTITRPDGSTQVTYNGHPLYFFANDSKAGQTNGQGVQGIWWVVSAAGKKVTKKAAVRSTAATTVQLRQTSVGMVLVDSRGHTLYLYAPDTSRKSTCAGQCAALWPPLLAHGKLVPGQGLKSSLLGTVERGDGKLQVTYGGHPLYGFASDDKPGDTHGQGMGGKWYVLGADGSKVEDSSGGGTTTTPGGGGGY